MGIYDDILDSVRLPRMYRVSQEFARDRVTDIAGTIRREISQIPDIGRVRGKQVALAVGSRGIANLPEIVKTVIDVLSEHGASLFIVPAMGSHGGAIAQNQKIILEHLGISEQAMGVPIRATMDTDCIGHTPEGVPVYFDHYANCADFTVSIARIKPHSSFRGKYESGMVKMSVIGLGKQRGADYCHIKGMANMGANLEKIGRVHMERSNLLFCLGLMENAYDQTCMIRAFPRDNILREEPALLEKAKTYLPRIPFGNLDLLVVDEIGKNITGTGMDCNIVQRFTSEHMIDNDFDTIRAGIKTAPDADYENLRIVRIKNTLRLDEMEISEALVREAQAMEHISGDWSGSPWRFSADGILLGREDETNV